MRKNKKLLLASVAAMGALALGVGATSTFAWYTATSSASVTNVNSDPHTVGSQASTFDDVTYKIQVAFKGSVVTGWSKVDLSDPNGVTYALDGASRVQTATASVGNYASYTPTAASFDVHIWANSADPASDPELSGADLTTALANLSATENKTYDVKVTGGSNVRVTLTNPTSGEGTAAQKFAAAMGGAGTGTEHIGQTVKVAELVFTDGAASFSNFAAFYWSVSGNTNNSVPTVGSADADSTTSNGGLITSIALQS